MEPVSSERLRAWIAEELSDLISIRHDLHAHPELGYEESRTSSVVQRELSAAGVENVGSLARGTGVLGFLPGAAATAIGLRADMDALPIEEENEFDYRSTNPGVMHACGHDGHTTMLIGAARVLAKIAKEVELPRPVKFVFQPAEETGAGAEKMIADGVLGDELLGPSIDSMFGMHGWPLWPKGQVGSRVGPLLAAVDSFDIEIAGIGAHAAFPHMSQDPIIAASSLVGALQNIISRETDPLDSAVLSVTKINAGSAYNVIPERASVAGTIRSLQQETRERIVRRIDECAAAICRAHRCESKLTISDGYPVTKNDAEAVRRFESVARAALGDARVAPVEFPVMGAEDFSFYCQQVPSCFFVLGLVPEGVESPPQLHQANFDFNDDVLATGVELFCRLALS